MVSIDEFVYYNQHFPKFIYLAVAYSYYNSNIIIMTWNKMNIISYIYTLTMFIQKIDFILSIIGTQLAGYKPTAGYDLFSTFLMRTQLTYTK